MKSRLPYDGSLLRSNACFGSLALYIGITIERLVPLLSEFTCNSFDIYFMAIVALLSLVLRVLNYPMPPLILGFILGGMIEKNLRRAVLINDGSFSFIWERPISLSLFIIAILIVLLQVYQGFKKEKE